MKFLSRKEEEILHPVRESRFVISGEEFQPVIEEIIELEALWRMTDDSSSECA